MSENAPKESSSAAPSEEGPPRSVSSEPQPVRNAIAALASMLGSGRAGPEEE